MAQRQADAFSYTQNSSRADATAEMAKKTLQADTDGFTGAVRRSEEKKGEFLGLTMLLEEGKYNVYGMRAMLSEESTSDRTVI